MPSKVPRRAVDRSGRPIEPHLCILSNPPGPIMLLRHLLRAKLQGVWLQKRSLSGRPPSRDHCTQDRHLVRSFVPYPTWFEHIVVCTFHGARRALRRESQEIESQTPLVSGRPLLMPCSRSAVKYCSRAVNRSKAVFTTITPFLRDHSHPKCYCGPAAISTAHTYFPAF